MPHEFPYAQDPAAQAPAVEVISHEAAGSNYIDYWNVVSAYYRETGQPEEARIAQRNHHDIVKLDGRLEHPEDTFLGPKRIPKEDVPEQWYRELGSLNPLEGSGPRLLLGFVRLWEAAGQKKFSHDTNNAFNKSVMEFTKRQGDTRIPAAIRELVQHPKSADRAILAGNALIDYVRIIPFEDRKEGHIYFLGKAKELYSGILSAVKEKDPSQHDQRTASDALKFKHEAIFEGITTGWMTGRMDEEEYKREYQKALYNQLGETIGLANGGYLRNGDLNEHYFAALLRYKAIWRDEPNLIVQSATRREDSPLDNFAIRNMPCSSFDAKIVDVTGEQPTSYVQLKLPDAHPKKYESGITVVDDLIDGEDRSEMREEIVSGMEQIKGLMHELLTGNYYAGGDEVITKHIERLETELAIV
jgi:hypothetical protein